MARFDDQVAVVTGAGSGTGAAIATQLAKEGASVVCTDLTAQTRPLCCSRSAAGPSGSTWLMAAVSPA